MLRRAAIIKSSKFKSKSKTESSTFKSSQILSEVPQNGLAFDLSPSPGLSPIQLWNVYVLDIRLKYSDAVSNEQSWI